MILTSVASVTFRKLLPSDVIELARETGLDAVEWGGDVHVPCGNLACAKLVGQLTRQAGLTVSAYGSYYRAGVFAKPEEAFEKVLHTACALQTDTVRIWVGDRGSAFADGRWIQGVYAELRRLVTMAERKGIRLAAEYHNNTLTDTLLSARELLTAVPGLYTLWQPPAGMEKQENQLALTVLRPRLANLHVFQRDSCNLPRPLAEGENVWKTYLRLAAACPGQRFATLEFVKDDSPEQFLRDAAVLHSWL